MKQYNLALSGLGGQGVMTVSQVLAVAAAREDVQVLLFEGTGIF
jgi:Pyruvate/2-oxoacid:ferredoxin oxidoreductase gamma subunit